MTEIKKNKSYIISFTLNEIKQLVIDNIDEANNIYNPSCLSRCKKYDFWHSKLINFYENNKKKKPSMVYKLCFVILLSYTKDFIVNLNDISEIKLFSHHYNPDFIYEEESNIMLIEGQIEARFDCICSYRDLHKIHIVKNKYSGCSLHIGSECIKKQNLISIEDFKKLKKTEKLLNEKRKELKEGKPIGYYKEEKERKKNQKEINKLNKMNKKEKEKSDLCLICDKINKCIKCIDCNNDFIFNNNKSRCESCQYNYENNFVNKMCISCNEEITIKKTELWRKYCAICYRELQNLIKNPSKCKCGLNMSEKTIKKDGINKGRKGLGCSQYPKGCNEFIIL